MELNHAGNYAWRLHLFAVAIFLQEAESRGMTPVQYAALHKVGSASGVDRQAWARTIGLDSSIFAGTADRLEARRLTQRSASPDHLRVRLLTSSDWGRRC